MGLYAPEEGKSEETKKIYDKLQRQVNKINKKKHVICCDLNIRIGKRRGAWNFWGTKN